MSVADPTLAPNGWPRHILEGFRAGETQSLTHVYRLHAREVAGMLRHGFSFESGEERRRFVGYGSGFELQDALHETFRRAFEPRARDGYDGIRPYGPYLQAIARNVVLRTFRAREVAFPRIDQGPSSAAVGSVEPIAGSPAVAPDQAVASEQLRALVDGFVASLDPLDARIVTLRFREGRGQREVAQLLRMGRQRVRTRERKIRERLLAHLRDRGEADLHLGAWPVVMGLLAEVLR